MVGFLLKIQPAQQIQRQQGGESGGGVLLSCIKVPPPSFRKSARLRLFPSF